MNVEIRDDELIVRERRKLLTILKGRIVAYYGPSFVKFNEDGLFGKISEEDFIELKRKKCIFLNEEFVLREYVSTKRRENELWKSDYCKILLVGSIDGPIWINGKSIVKEIPNYKDSKELVVTKEGFFLYGKNIEELKFVKSFMNL